MNRAAFNPKTAELGSAIKFRPDIGKEIIRSYQLPVAYVDARTQDENTLNPPGK